MRSEFEFNCTADLTDIYYTVTESIVQQLISQELSIIEDLICWVSGWPLLQDGGGSYK